MQQSPCTYCRYQYSRNQKKTTSPFSDPILRLYGQNCSDYNLQESQRLSLNSHIFLFFPNLCRTMIEKRVCIKTKTAVLIIRAPEYFRAFWKHSLCVQKKVWLTFHFTHITHTIYFPPEYFCLDSQSRNTSSTLAFRKTRRNKGFISPCWLIILDVLHLVFNQTFIFECCWHEASAVRPLRQDQDSSD